jgi:hypothetical protein
MIDRTLFFVGWAAVTWFALQTLPITALAIKPESVSIEGDQVTLVRDFPTDAMGLPRPWLSYVETVRPLTQGHNGGHICEQKAGPFRYSENNPVGTWSIAWASDCLSDPQGFTWSASWTWWIGNLQLGPTDFRTRVLRDPCQYRVSLQGIIHGPDSPHWSQTSTERCFPTRAEAEASLP